MMLEKLTVKEFLKNNLIIVLFLAVLLVVSLAVFIVVFWGELYNVGAWGSLVAGVFTYIGSSFLGLVVFYNTQSQQRQKEIDNQINVQINISSGFEKQSGYFVPYLINQIDRTKYTYNMLQYIDLSHNNMSFLYFEVINRNPYIPVYVEPVSIYVFTGKKFIDAGCCSYFSNMDDSFAIDYKQKKCCYIGKKKELLKYDYYKEDEKQLCYLSFKIASIKGQIQYAACEFFMGVTLGTSNPRFFTEEEFEKRVKKLGTPFFSPLCVEQTICYNEKKHKENAR